MNHGFKYHGLLKDVAVFTIEVPQKDGQSVSFMHYKADKDLNVQKISYADTSLSECNTTTHRSDGSIVPARSSLTTESESIAFLEALMEKDIELKGLGKIADMSFEIIKNYSFKVGFNNDHSTYNYYEGRDFDEALEKAKVNNPRALSIELYEGSMAGKSSI